MLACALTACTAAAMLAGGAAPALAAGAGTPDTAFAGGSAALPGAKLLATATQGNGDVIAVGESGAGSSPRVLVARYTASGALDSSFGSGGVASGPALNGVKGTIANAVAVQPDGKIVVVGTATDTTGTAHDGLLVERFNANGSVDGGFGSGGVADLFGTGGQGLAVALQSNGDIVAAGSATIGGVPYAAVARLNPNGSADGSFAGGGSDIINLGAYSMAQAVAIQSNGDIVIAGSQSPGLQAVNALIARLKPSGALDTSFAGTGAVAKQYAPAGGAYSSYNALVIQGDGKIVAVGSATGGNEDAYAIAVRYTTSGGVDGSYGSGGVTYLTAAQQWLEQGNVVPGASAAALAPNGDVIIGGDYAQSVITYGVLWALAPSGKGDGSFGHNGVASFAPSNGSNVVFNGLSLSPTTGNLFAVGATSSFGSSATGGVTAGFVGYGPPKGGGGSTSALKLTVSKISASYKHGTLRLTAACNQACKLSIALGGGAGLARQLKLPTLVKKCQTHHGHKRCHKVTEYKAVTVASASTTFRQARSQTFTLRLSKGALNGLHKQRSVKMTLSVKASSPSTHKTVKFTKSVKFAR